MRMEVSLEYNRKCWAKLTSQIQASREAKEVMASSRDDLVTMPRCEKGYILQSHYVT